MEDYLAIFIGSSLSFGGIGGLLSGVFSRTFRCAIAWATLCGLLDVALLCALSPARQINGLLLVVALIWGTVGWLAIGRLRAASKSRRAE
ncbi:hypothetical protein P2H44_25230 [Albimonas sp. CAU 1670]|uniref:hypothetical protein n=1 Tax=Albimonas sp. CAU 1670 TaxID=3032599 RepID=UPI0023DC09ED|nr:hypothetical protein [Albimonas sp. CAU 1670]MDF2235869.1 hypothetical protein [Albimonas sp. CAU 1670]